MSDELKNQLRRDLVFARKGRDKRRTLVLSTILADVHNKEIEKRLRRMGIGFL